MRTRGVRAEHARPLRVLTIACVALVALPCAVLPCGAAAPAPVVGNTMCPVLTDEKIDPQYSVMYNGRRVYLCCGRCVRRFEADPEAFAKNLPPLPAAAVATAPSGTTDAAGATRNADAKPLSLPALTLRWLGRTHPAAVHFPIALLATAGFAAIRAARRRRPGDAEAARLTLWLGALSAALAAPLGWAAAAFARVAPETAPWLTAHRWTGTSAAVVALAAALASSSPRARSLSPWLLALAIALVLATGFLGGAVVWGPDHLAFF